MAFYFRLFWAPAIASAVLLAMAWADGEWSTRTTATLIAWFFIAFALQFFATPSALWIAGLVLQTSLAVFLAIRRKLAS